MTLRSKHLAVIIPAVFVAGIAGTMIFNLWQTTSDKVPVTYDSGEFAGEYNPADIRGSYSFADIEETFGVPVAVLAEAFGVEARDNPGAFLCKELEDLYGVMENGEIGTDSVRWFVALYRGLPYTPAEDTLLPSPAIPILAKRVSEAELQALRTRTAGFPGIEPPEAAAAAETEQPASEPVAAAGGAVLHSEGETATVRGQTTFAELMSWGVSEKAIEEALGLPVGQPAITLRDYCLENGIEFSAVRDRLQAAVDQASRNP
jgi:hypothetical protein